jgi:NAD(P)-dependent dehydrogenase (short-subunit alcohol dehydrogenase family)
MLDSKVAVITGAGQGIGKASTEVFVREGAKVLAVDISGAEKDTAAELGTAVVPWHADATKEAEIGGMIEAAVDAFGRLDVMLNVVGAVVGRGEEYLSLDDYDVQTSLNLRGTLLCMKQAIPVMLETGGGAIVNISTVGSLNVEDRAPAMYMAAKSALNTLTKAVAVEYGRQGIRANVIATGFTLTETTRKIPPELLPYMAEKAALGRPGEALEQAEVAAFLASDRASFVTGAVVPVDGGWSARLA